MCDASDVQDEVERLSERVDRLENYCKLLLDNAKLAIKYTPEQYDLVDQKEIDQSAIPTVMKMR